MRLFFRYCFFLGCPGFGQLNRQLCKTNEDIVFAFQLQNQKWVSICKEYSEAYLVYRFGKIDKVELQFPDVLDSSSWSKFSLKAYYRGGGKQNAAMYFAYLHFKKNDSFYEVYDMWTSENDLQEIGVNVKTVRKKVEMKGLLKSHKYTLLSLMDSEKLKREEEQCLLKG